MEDKEFHAMTEETANELTKAFEEFGNATKELENTLIDITTAFLEDAKFHLGKQVEYYTKKVESACFITRWWYKRKLQKQKDTLEAINIIIKEHHANIRSKAIKK